MVRAAEVGKVNVPARPLVQDFTQVGLIRGRS
jgi:hypothetical protein